MDANELFNHWSKGGGSNHNLNLLTVAAVFMLVAVDIKK
jgi:hypothetical protein